MKIGIIGAGFSGMGLLLALSRLKTCPLEIILFEKTGDFAAGEAYKTPYPFHLLNVKANDMSAYFDDPHHFVNWLRTYPDTSIYMDETTALDHQYAPRCFYGAYLKALLAELMSNKLLQVKVKLIQAEVIQATPKEGGIALTTHDQQEIIVDKVVLAMGNFLPERFPFPVALNMNCIYNPWDYRAPSRIPPHDPVLIVGTGLSMIDTVLTLHHHHHQAPIYAVSRHGLMPLPHQEFTQASSSAASEWRPNLRLLTKKMRAHSKTHMQSGGNWREIISLLRPHAQLIWEQMSLADKRRFLRHVLPYWNIHRHRVHHDIAALLNALIKAQQLHIIAGRVMRVDAGKVQIKERQTHTILEYGVGWVINCMGPSATVNANNQALLQSLLTSGLARLDAFGLGFETSKEGVLKEASGAISSSFYTVGPLRRGMCWESGAVPDIRKQCYDLAKYLIA